MNNTSNRSFSRLTISLNKLSRIPVVATVVVAAHVIGSLALAQTAGLVAAYSFNEGGGTTVSDASGNGNNGTLSGTTWTNAGKYGGALVFNGTSARVTINNSASLQLTTGMTLEAWVKPSTISSAWRDVVYKGNDNYYLEGTSDHSSRPAAGGTFSSTEVFGTAALTVNTWTHIAATYDRITLRLYVNGTQIASRAQTGNISTSTNPLQIGGDSIYGQYFKGTIDEVRVYNVALTPAQIQTDMNTPVAPDTQVPTTPGSLVAASASGTQINLSWSASTDNVGVTAYLVERSQGAGSTSFTQVATPSATNYNDIGLTPATVYNYRVRATDAAGNLSAYSTIVTASTPDTVPPSTPLNLTAAAVSGSEIDLSWAASTDNVGVTGYLIERCQGNNCTTFTQVATTTGLSYNDAGLSTGNTYRYRVRAVDGAGNLSGYSSIGTATIPDTQAPSAPGNFVATAIGGSQVNLSWTPATDNVGVTGYFIERCQGGGCVTFAQIGSTGELSYSDTGLTAATSYSYRVRATDAAANLGPYSAVASTTMGSPDTEAPSVPTNLVTSAVSGTQISVTWFASTDNVAVTSYLVERSQGVGSTSFSQVAAIAGTNLIDSGLTTATVYNYRVRASDAATNLSAFGVISTATTLDTQAPSAPGTPAATVVSDSQINLNWAAASDNVGVTGYLIERCQGPGCATFSQIGVIAGTSYSDSGLSSGVSYSYRVRATDAAGNLSVYSGTGTATTPDTQPPGAPGGPAATAVSGSQISLSWTAASDNVGVTGYLVERCQGGGCTTFSQVGIVSGLGYNDTGLTPGASYSYRVRATDAAGNNGPYSTTVSATTPTTIPGLVAAYAFNEGSGSTVADASGNNNSGTIGSATWTSSGKFGGALSFNGTSARVTVNNSVSLQLTSGMTLEAWVSPSVVNNAWRDVIYKADDNYYLEGTSDNGTLPGAGGTFSGAPLYATAPLTANTWAHLALTYDKSTLRLYVNGAQVGSRGQTANIATSTNPLQIGGDSFYGQYFQGMIDEVRIYNVALTAAQIQSDMATPIGTVAPDTQPPTIPSNPVATAISGNQINLSWTASSDNVGVTGYLIERQDPGSSSFVQIATTNGLAYSDAGLAAASTYGYRIRASDAAGNLSLYSSVVTTTTSAPDTQPPSAPANVVATPLSGTQINLSWNAATDNVAVTGYRVERCQGAGCTEFIKLAYPTDTNYSDTGLTSNTSYSYIVRATDAAGNLGEYSGVATVVTLAQPPSLMAAFSFDEGSGTSVSDSSGNANNGAVGNGVTWSSNGKFGNALVFNGGLVSINNSSSLQLLNAMTLEAWVNPSVVNNAWRDVIYKADDNYYLEGTSDNGAVPGAGGTFSGNPLYGIAPLIANVWTHLALTYDKAMLRLYVNGTEISNRPQTANIETSSNPLQIGGDNIYGQYFQGAIDEVRIYNRALSSAEIQSDMNTPIGIVVGGLPSAPGNLTATVVGTGQIDLHWMSSTGSLVITSYLIERCQGANCSGFSQIASTPGTTSFSDIGLSANDSYSYRVRAMDSGGNLSPYSTIAQEYTGLTVSPKVVALTVTSTQQFTCTIGSVTWLVDGVIGGTASSGTITASGLYTPRNTVGSHLITATTLDQSQSGSATVFVSAFDGKFTHHNDNFRTGQNLNETVLSPANVNAATFGKLFTYPIDGASHASPLYVANLNVPGQGFHNVVLVATEHNSVYAYDADGLVGVPLWKTSFINPDIGVTTVPANNTGECCDIAPEIGITSTPVIDPASGTLYVVAKTMEVVGSTTSYVQRLHALDITSGAEKFGGSIIIQATVSGNGSGSAGGQLPLDPLHENQRPALLLNNGVIYMGFASHGDISPWHGWILGYNATTLQQTMAFCATPNSYGGGIWQSGSGPAADSAGNVYCMTANGPFNANTSGRDYGDTFLKIAPNATIVDYFTPHNQDQMESQNADLASSGPMLLPDQPGPTPHLMVGAGKDQAIYLINRDNMGHYNANNDSQIVQSLPGIFPNGTPEPGNYSSPVYFNGTIYFSPVADKLKAFRLTNGLLSTSPSSQSPEIYAYPGGTIAISANGTSNGILWAIQRNGTLSPGTLRAYDPANLATEFYNSDQAGTRDTLDFAAKFSVPLIANGKVFVTSLSQLTVYGLLP